MCFALSFGQHAGQPVLEDELSAKAIARATATTILLIDADSAGYPFSVLATPDTSAAAAASSSSADKSYCIAALAVASHTQPLCTTLMSLSAVCCCGLAAQCHQWCRSCGNSSYWCVTRHHWYTVLAIAAQVCNS
jgi:hypothetical protein